MTEPLEPPRARCDPRPILALLILMTLGASVATLVVRSADSGAGPAKPRPLATDAAAARHEPRLVAIRALLEARSAAILHHDRAGFLSTVDPSETAFYSSQARMFTNLATVTFASWSYTMSRHPASYDGGKLLAYNAPAWAPARFALHYRIAGFDPVPTRLRQYPTFVERSGRWLLASFSDFSWRGQVSATDLWDYAPVQVVNLGNVLALGPSTEQATLLDVATEAQMEIAAVTTVWGPGWARRVVVQVPATQHEMAMLTDDHDDLDQIAAITSAELSDRRGRPEPVGDRITVNPFVWPSMSALGTSVVMAHELTHIATRADTGVQTPRWLAEGFADYVGFHAVTVIPVPTFGAELAKQVRAGRLPRALPTANDFRGGAPGLARSYEEAWLACRYIAARAGQPALVRFYRLVGRSRQPTGPAVASALRRVLGLTPAGFVARWRHYVEKQLG